MTTSMLRRLTLLFLASLGIVATASSQNVPPSIFFTDLTSGPNSGGESVSGYGGAYVTIYGNNFGSSQGTSTITWNGLNCLRVVPASGNYTGWGMSYFWYQKIVVQIGSSCTPGTGNFVVTVSGQSSSYATERDSTGAYTVNPSQFTVRSTGTIRCISTSGSDSNSGTFSGGCWKTMGHAVNGGMSQGDIVYVENGVNQTSGGAGPYGSVTPTASGTNWTSTPYALVTYPGAASQIGSISNDGIFLCSNDLASACSVSNLQYWTFAGFTILGQNSAFGIAHNVNNIRVVGTDMSCPNGNGSTACVTSNAVPPAIISGFYFYGNQVHNSGTSSAIKTYHNVYWSNNTEKIYHAWGIVHDGGGCRGILINPSNGSGQYDIHIHDNYVYNTRCDAINLNYVNPNNGLVEVYNNVINNGGEGPDPSDGQAAYGCVDINSTGTTSVQVYNNTMYNCGARKLSGSAGAILFASGSGPSTLVNNVVYQLSGEAYNVNNGRTCAQMFDSNSASNDWYGAGAPPCTITGNLNADPQLTNPGSAVFTLASSSSPMNGAGSTSPSPPLDHLGLVRPSPPSVGAYEYTSSTSAQRPAAPTNLIVTVN